MKATKASRAPSRRVYAYERVVSVFGILLAVGMAVAGLSIGSLFVVVTIGMARWGTNK